LLLLPSADAHGSSLDQIAYRPPSRKPHLQTVAPHRCSPATPRLPRHLHDPGTGPTPPSQYSFFTTACRSAHARLFLSYEPLRWTTGSLWHLPPFPLALDFAPHMPKLPTDAQRPNYMQKSDSARDVLCGRDARCNTAHIFHVLAETELPANLLGQAPLSDAHGYSSCTIPAVSLRRRLSCLATVVSKFDDHRPSRTSHIGPHHAA
jgi:hypothetical protein